MRWGVSIMILGLLFSSCGESKKSAAAAYPYRLIDQKKSKEGPVDKQISTYVYSDKIDSEQLKSFFISKQIEAEKNYNDIDLLIVIFDKKENAFIPRDVNFAEFGMDEKKSKSVRAYYCYKKMNKYSEWYNSETEKYEKL
ncbi:MAG: hypothetical protein KA369_08215 [Spirochaetes bacterium]|nr:hypothetical protein [Spirochaetota bacterium]